MDPRKVAITLVCAAKDEAVLDPIIERLRADNYEAELVPGVDHQARRVGEAIERCGEWGMIIACTSEHLAEPELRAVEGVFSARRPNHAIVRVDASVAQGEIVSAILNAVEAFASSQSRIVRRATSESRKLSSLALPVVRLAPEEEIDGDTTRIQLPDNPKSAELSRRRRAARERERERERITERSTANRPPRRKTLPPVSEAANEDSAKLDRLMVVIIIGAGILAVLAGVL